MNSKNKDYIKFIIAVAILTSVIGYVMHYFTANTVDEARPVSEKFMINLKEQNFTEVERLLKSGQRIEDLFSDEGIIYTFKEVGYGAN